MTVFLSQITAFASKHLGADIDNVVDDFEVQGITTKYSLRDGHLAFSHVFDADLLTRASQMSKTVLIFPKGGPNAGPPCVRVDNPRLAFAKIIEAFFVPKPMPGIHPTAVVDSDAQISPTATVGAFCVIGPRCKIGANTVLHKHVVLSKDITIGADCVLWSHCVLGEDGFGIERTQAGLQKRLPHLGGVVLGDGIQIGNFTSIVAGTIEPTRIGDGTMIDNLVHIAHNVQIGKNCQVIACAEVSGSVILHDNTTIAPNATVIQKVEIGESSLVGLGAVVTKSVPANVVVAGVPAKVIRTLSQDKE